MKPSAAFLLLFTTILPAQVKQTSVPLADTLKKALAGSSLTAPGDKPFHLRMAVSEPENPKSPYRGTIEEWWSSPQEWRREVTDIAGNHQVIVVEHGVKTEEDTGDYLPLWLQQFVTAAFNPVPSAAAWNAQNAMITQMILPYAQSDACARAQSKIGVGDRVTNVYSDVCFSRDGRLKSVLDPGYFMEFADYRSFGKHQFPRTFSDDPESGTHLVGNVTQLEDLSKSVHDDTFHPLSRNDDRFTSAHVSPAQLDAMTATFAKLAWPRVRSGNLTGHVALYISTDASGHIREAWPLSGDNGEIHDFSRAQAITWQLPAGINASGRPVQMEGPISLFFQTSIGVPLPELSNAETRALAITLAEPHWPEGKLHHGDIVKLQVAVDEHGQVAGATFQTFPAVAMIAIDHVYHSWTFHPLIRDGKPQYFHGNLEFVIP